MGGPEHVPCGILQAHANQIIEVISNILTPLTQEAVPNTAVSTEVLDSQELALISLKHFEKREIQQIMNMNARQP